VTSTGEQVCESVPEWGGDPCNAASDISADGQRVVFTSDAPDLVPGDHNRTADVFLHDLKLHQTTRVSVDSAGGEICERRPRQVCNYGPAISGDGRYVTFESKAADVVPNDFNRKNDVFLHGPL
jgi:Tol biopolymer transport system component